MPWFLCKEFRNESGHLFHLPRLNTTELRRLCSKSLPTYNFRSKTAYLLCSTAVTVSWLSDPGYDKLLEILQPFDSTWRLWSSIILKKRYTLRGSLRNSECNSTLEIVRIFVWKKIWLGKCSSYLWNMKLSGFASAFVWLEVKPSLWVRGTRVAAKQRVNLIARIICSRYNLHQ